MNTALRPLTTLALCSSLLLGACSAYQPQPSANDISVFIEQSLLCKAGHGDFADWLEASPAFKLHKRTVVQEHTEAKQGKSRIRVTSADEDDDEADVSLTNEGDNGKDESDSGGPKNDYRPVGQQTAFGSPIRALGRLGYDMSPGPYALLDVPFDQALSRIKAASGERVSRWECNPHGPQCRLNHPDRPHLESRVWQEDWGDGSLRTSVQCAYTGP